MPGALDGVRIVDMTGVGMGPWATQMLGDMGADVIKIETADGDVFRHVTPQRHHAMSHAYLNFNRNKRSVVLDAKAPEGREAILRLVKRADVFISNVRSAGLRRLGLDYESLREINPRIIYCGCYGYSEAGPYAGRPAIDDTIQAASGVAWFQGVGAEAPRYANTALADKVLSLFISNAISTALYAREKTGKGQAIEVPMFECMVSFMMPEHLAGLTFLPPEGPAGYTRMLDPYRKPFRTRDGYISAAPYTNLQWRSFFKLAGRPELADDPRFRTQVDRSRHFGELYRFVEETLANRTTAEWAAALEKADIPFAPVNSVQDLLDDPHLRAIGFWQEFEHPSEGRVRAAGIPVNYSETPGSIRRHAPGLGEHTDEVLREIGLK
ncbi:MAG: CoA transferase [Betaproteobacteria bacterium]|nr:CoA transferase [Betaproteobacteria bacterium]